ncbi:MAG: hypothetical protein AAF757_19530 [Cyanobacteria bacterium P01_D01_bin.116]
MKNTLLTTSYILGGLGAAICVVPFIPAVFQQVGAAIKEQQNQVNLQLQKSAITRREELRRYSLIERRKSLDAASRAGEQVEYSNVTVKNYTSNVNHPPKLDMSAFKPNQRIQVFDRNGVCIGRIRNQRFEWKRFFLNTCLTIENQQESK